MNPPIKLAFPLLGRGGWTGGFIYLKNTLALINARLASQIEPYVFLSPEENERFGAELAPLVGGRIITGEEIAVAGRGKSLVASLLAGRDWNLERLLKKSNIDVVFENASFYGAHFGIPVISWIPDFQHRHMPEMFGRLNWWRRELGFRMQLSSKRTIMLSSNSAAADLKRFYPSHSRRPFVVRFAINMTIPDYPRRAREMRELYQLPERFFFLPNQIWQHKNHGVIIGALEKLKSEGRLEQVLPIVLTGQSKDPRNSNHFDILMGRVKAAGLERHFRYLGLISYDHVLSLNAACERLINPSFFEGWSTPIEEAKAFGTALILSDIPIHREQAPEALFFNPRLISESADALVGASNRRPDARPPLEVLVEEQETRLRAHAEMLLAAVQGAISPS